MLRDSSDTTGKLLHMALIALIALTEPIAFECPQVMIQIRAISVLLCKRAAAEIEIARRGIASRLLTVLS